MAEAAGLVLSALSLFTSCVEGYEALRIIRDQSKDAATIACCLEIEEKRLVLWGRNAGLLEDSCLIPARDLDTILIVLRQVEALTKDASTLKTRYKLKLDVTQEQSGSSIQSRYVPGLPGLPLQKIFKARSIKHSVRWLFDSAKFNKLVEDLRNLNNGLNSLLREGQEANCQREFAMMAIQTTSTDNVDTLRAIRDAAQRTYTNLSYASDQRLHFLQLQTNSSGEQDDEAVASPVPMSSIKVLYGNDTKSRAFGTFGSTRVLIEWRKHRGESMQNVRILLKRMAGLAELFGRTPKPQSFRVLDCLGYYHDEIEERIGLLFRLPDQTGGQLEMTTLFELLQSRQQSSMPLPTLYNRFRLASALANSLLQLQGAKWLHRNFSSANIILLCDEQQSQRVYLDQYICGFEYSREDASSALSLPFTTPTNEMPYQHPDLVANPHQGYRMEFDAYSLGIVLVEIGFWKPISTFLKSSYTLHQNRERILKYQLNGDLAHRMGEPYEELVKMLLLGKAYGGEPSEPSRLLHFFQNIVVPLSQCSVV